MTPGRMAGLKKNRGGVGASDLAVLVGMFAALLAWVMTPGCWLGE